MKKIFVLLLAGIMAFSAAGCSQGQKSSQNGDTVSLKIGMPNGNDLTPTEILEGFKKENPNIKVEIDETPWSDFKTKLKMQIAAGNAPDVFLTDSGYAATLGGMGAAVDLSEKINTDLNKDDFTSALDIINDGNGKVWGVTHSLSPAAVLYNKSIFDEYGVAYPEENWTFQDMLDIAQKLTKDTDGDGVTDIYGLSSGGNMTTGWLPFILAAGGAPIDETQTKSLFADPKTLEGLKQYHSTVNVSKVSPSNTWLTSSGNVTSAFYSGKIAMYIDLWGTTKAINQNAPEGFSYDAQMMPIGWNGERSCIYVPNQWIVYSKSGEAQQEAAWEWIKYFLTESSQDVIANNFNSIGFPVRKSALKTIESIKTVPENKGAFYGGLDEYGVTLFECPSWEEWKPKAEQAFLEMQNGVITPEEASERVDKIVSELLAK